MGFTVQGKAPTRKMRHEIQTDWLPTNEGAVAVGSINDVDYIVHAVGRQTESITTNAVASAVAGGLIDTRDVCEAFGETGRLAELVEVATAVKAEQDAADLAREAARQAQEAAAEKARERAEAAAAAKAAKAAGK